MRTAGVNIAGGQIYIAIVEPSSNLLAKPVGESVRLKRNAHLAERDALIDLKSRLRQHLQVAGAARIALVETRLNSGWQYKHAYDRLLAVSATMFAASELNLAFETVKTERISKAVGVPAKALETVHFEDFGFTSRPKYWTAGLAEAYAVTAVA